MKSNIEVTADLTREVEACAKIMFVLEGFCGQKAAEILTGVLVSIIGTTANDGKEGAIVDAVIKELKEGTEAMKNMKPIGVIIATLKKKQQSCPGHLGGKVSLN